MDCWRESIRIGPGPLRQLLAIPDLVRYLDETRPGDPREISILDSLGRIGAPAAAPLVELARHRRSRWHNLAHRGVDLSPVFDALARIGNDCAVVPLLELVVDSLGDLEAITRTLDRLDPTWVRRESAFPVLCRLAASVPLWSAPKLADLHDRRGVAPLVSALIDQSDEHDRAVIQEALDKIDPD